MKRQFEGHQEVKTKRRMYRGIQGQKAEVRRNGLQEGNMIR